MQVNSQSLRILRELGVRYADAQRVQSFVIKVNRGQVFRYNKLQSAPDDIRFAIVSW